MTRDNARRTAGALMLASAVLMVEFLAFLATLALPCLAALAWVAFGGAW